MKTSQNGWPLIWDSSLLDRSKIPGTNRVVELRSGAARTVLGYLCREFNARVEPLDEPSRDDWGWAPPALIPGSKSYSNHGSGTAVDLNALLHTWGKKGTFTVEQQREIRAILAELYGTVRWGGDYTGTVDEMHFEITASDAAIERLAQCIDGKPGVFMGIFAAGSVGVEVRAIQKRLSELGGYAEGVAVDGIFGPQTASAIREFQKNASLSADGIVGPETIVRLFP